MGGSTGTATSKTTAQPWDKQIPYIEQGMSEAKKIYNTPGPEYYTGNTVAGFAPEQEQAFSRGTQRATQGNQTMNMAEGFTQDVLGGKYLNDPYNDQVFNNIQSKVMPSVNSNFSSAGRYGSGMHADTATRALTESYAPYASQQRQQGLDRMGQASNAASMFAQNDYRDLAALEAIGGQRQGLAQNEIDDAVSRWNYNRDLPANKLGQYMGFIGGNYGGTTTSAQPYYKPSMFSQILGGGLGLAGLLG
jgi:hypothetical protein